MNYDAAFNRSGEQAKVDLTDLFDTAFSADSIRDARDLLLFGEIAYACALHTADSFAELGRLAHGITEKLARQRVEQGSLVHDPVGLVCARDSKSGQTRTKETVEALVQTDYRILYTPMFDTAIRRIKREEKAPHEFLNGFYRPLLESLYVDLAIFLHDWESDIESRWLHALAEEQGQRIVVLPSGYPQ